jgi:hypothetical protein
MLAAAAALLSVIVVAITSATAAWLFVPSLPAVCAILIFALFALFVTVPHFALVSGVLPHTTWLRAYTAFLRRVPFLRTIVGVPRQLISTSSLTRCFQPLIDNRTRAYAWKQLHEELQTAALKVYIVKGLVNQSDLNVTLHDLEMHWSFECSDMLRQFIGLEGLPDGTVKTEFVAAEHNARWLSRLLESVNEIDEILAECSAAETLRKKITSMMIAIGKIEKIISELLKYLDKKLQRTIQELDGHIENARTALGAAEDGQF